MFQYFKNRYKRKINLFKKELREEYQRVYNDILIKGFAIVYNDLIALQFDTDDFTVVKTENCFKIFEKG